MYKLIACDPQTGNLYVGYTRSTADVQEFMNVADEFDLEAAVLMWVEGLGDWHNSPVTHSYA